jgi:hypothetical protein
MAVNGEGLIVHVHGPSTDGIRVSDRRGWAAGGDIDKGVMGTASATGPPSHGEHLTLDTAELLVRVLNVDGAAWGPPVLLEGRFGFGVDCIARDTQDPCLPPLLIQVTRPTMSKGFWKDISLNAKAEVQGGTAAEMADDLWGAIEQKRFSAQPNVVLALMSSERHGSRSRPSFRSSASGTVWRPRGKAGPRSGLSVPVEPSPSASIMHLVGSCCLG